MYDRWHAPSAVSGKHGADVGTVVGDGDTDDDDDTDKLGEVEVNGVAVVVVIDDDDAVVKSEGEYEAVVDDETPEIVLVLRLV